MQEGETFEVLLDEKLNKYAKFLETKELPELQKEFRIILTSYQSIYNTLLQKGLIRSDPYKNDRKISDITPPSKTAFLESDKMDQISIRLSEYDSQFDFINNYFNFSIETLSLDKLKKIIELLNYIQWKRVIDTSIDINTRVLAELITKIKSGTDSFAAKLIAENISQIGQSSDRVKAVFKKLTVYYRETYKQTVDERIMYKLKVPSENIIQNMEKVVKLVKQNFPRELPDRPFYPELVKELIMEKFSAQKPGLQSAVLEKLTIADEKPKEKKEITHKTILLEAIFSLSATGGYLEKSLQKIAQNNNILESRKRSMGERFRQWIKSVLKKKNEDKVLELELFDENTGVRKNLKMQLNNFLDASYKKTRLMFTLSNKMSTSIKKLQLADEDYILDFLNRQIGDMNVILQKLPPLDTYFKSEAPKEERPKIRGIKLEITGMKNCIVKANQKKHDYVSKREEVEQLKKLGIDIAD